jgi:hypothetical protein
MRIRALIATTAALAALAAPASAPAAPAPASAAPADCTLIPVPARSPIAYSRCAGIRPGAIVRTDKGRCTLNFVFRGSDGRNYIGTAGHCILGEGLTLTDVGERTWGPGAGPVVRDASRQRIGEFAYAVLSMPKDFALIRLDPGVAVNPQTCHFGGPTGINNERGGPATLEYFGNGLVIGALLPARSGFAAGTRDPDRTFALALALPGDSGGPVQTVDGRAYGLVFGLGIAVGTEPGTVGITRLGPQLGRAQQALGVGMTLATAPPA